LENFRNDIDELIGKYLAGEASADEIVMVETWAAEKEANQKYLNQHKTIFEKAATVKEWQEFDTDAAWNKLKSKIQKPAGKVVPLRQSSSYSFLKIAASLILVMGVGFWLYKFQRTDPVEVVAQKEAVSDTLPDGSGVFLNKQTNLTYAYDKKKKTHTVKLKGEAYFSIKHEDDKKFIIETEGLYIRDIGTSFNVKSYPESNTVEVVVIEGEVVFFTENNPGIHLRANGKGTYNKTTKTFSIDQPENNTLAYKTKFFSFSDTDLGTAVATLNEVYETKISIPDHLRECPLTVSFNNEDIQEIAAVIAETLGLTATDNGNEIRLEGAGCE
jgi:transmembrane sensor